jgi:2-polyprenyl-3-methyl-5-hydroxy-6-metoxy-1,4-benzoquinol methylase
MNSGVHRGAEVDGLPDDSFLQTAPVGCDQQELTREQATELVRQRYPAHTPVGRCLACGSRHTHPFASRRGFRIARCRTCSFLWVDPMIAARDMWTFYARRTWQPYTAEVLRRKFRQALRVVRAQVPAGARILDVGCGHGHFAALLSRAGYQVEGVDIDGKALAYAADHYGLLTHQGALPHLAFAQRFAAVTILSALEHMPDPLAVLTAVARVLKSDGVLIVSTPRGDGLIPRLSRRFFLPTLGIWEFLSPPSHLTYFTRRSLAAMLERAGLRAVAFLPGQRDGGYKRRELLQTLQEEAALAPAWARWLYLGLRYLRLPARLLHAGDMMICVAHRRAEAGRTGTA